MTCEATVKRLCRRYAATTQEQRQRGAEWYDNERKWLREQAEPHGVSERYACAVFAALSPQMPWDRNRKLTLAVLGGATESPGGVFPNSWRRAVAARNQGPMHLGGPKVMAFDCNLAGCTECITVDVHMFRIAGYPPDANYEAVAACYRMAARRCGVPPAHFQATLWLAYRPERPSDPDERLT
jgi:hypothetical protein